MAGRTLAGRTSARYRLYALDPLNLRFVVRPVVEIGGELAVSGGRRFVAVWLVLVLPTSPSSPAPVCAFELPGRSLRMEHGGG